MKQYRTMIEIVSANRIRLQRSRNLILVGIITGTLFLASCGFGSDDDPSIQVSNAWSNPVGGMSETNMDHDDQEFDEHAIHEGEELFHDVGCSSCHGDDAMGTDIAPALQGHTADQVKQQVRTPKDVMPAFSEEQISDEELDQIAAYVASLEGESEHEHDAAESEPIGVVYLTIDNSGGGSDTLLSASSMIAEFVEIHETSNADGVMQMRPVTTVEIPGDESVVFEPGGYHIMLINLQQDLLPGDTFVVEFEFESSGTIAVTSNVLEDGITVDMQVDPDPPEMGPMTLTFILTGDDGHAVTGADLAIEGNMSHAGMQAVSGDLVEDEPGHYVTKEFELSMGGDWIITVSGTLVDGSEFSRTVDLSGVGG